MRLFNVIETVLNCLYMALEIWDWLETHFPVFGVSGVVEPKRQLRGSIKWSRTGKSICCD